MSLHALVWTLKYYYCQFMLAFLGHALAQGSRSEPFIRFETAQLPENFTFSMGLIGQSGPRLYMEKRHDRLYKIRPVDKVDIHIGFKHLEHAFLVLSFQEGTAAAFAKDRMIIDGDLSTSMALVRCFNRVEAITLPKFIAKRIIKRYPNIKLMEKLTSAISLYLGVGKGFITGGR